MDQIPRIAPCSLRNRKVSGIRRRIQYYFVLNKLLGKLPLGDPGLVIEGGGEKRHNNTTFCGTKPLQSHHVRRKKEATRHEQFVTEI